MQFKIHEIFHIPPHILLPEDSVQRDQHTSDEERKLDEEIESLKSRFKRVGIDKKPSIYSIVIIIEIQVMENFFHTHT